MTEGIDPSMRREEETRRLQAEAGTVRPEPTMPMPRWKATLPSRVGQSAACRRFVPSDRPRISDRAELGRGGMGVVYKARNDPRSRRDAQDDPGRRVCRSRSRLAVPGRGRRGRRLQHPNIVQIYHVGEHAGHPFFEMEYVGGGSLAERLGGKPWPARARS